MRTTTGRKRSLAAIFGAAMLGVASWLAAAPAGATTVSTEAQLRSAFGDAAEMQIDLANDITLTDCAAGALTRNSATDLTFDGHGFTIRQTCPDRVVNQDSTGGLTFRQVTITGGNTSDAGGGVETDGDLVLENATFRDNTAQNGGGAIDGFVVDATNSAILDNRGGSASGGGILGTDITLTGSTVAGNSSSGAPGGGVAGQAVMLVNSTVTNNTGIDLGGGVFIGQGSISLVYSTVVGNTAELGANINQFSAASTFTSFGSVVARPQGGVNCVVGDVTSNGFNFSDDESCDLTAATDRQNAGDPALAPLADNGGPTPTLLPEAGSPLVDGIPLASCQDDGASGITTDQRGLPRPAGTGCDVGAVEVQPVPPPPTPVPPAPVPPAPAVVATARFTG